MRNNDDISVYENIKVITEAYMDAISQMDNAVKSHNQYTKKRSAESEKNQGIAQYVLGQRLFKQYMNHGNMESYAPVPLNGINLSLSDIQAIFNKYIADDETLEKYTDKIIAAIKKHYTRQQFTIRNGNIYTDIVFSTFDAVCDFIAYVHDAVFKAFKGIPENCINWKPFVSKFRNYLK